MTATHGDVTAQDYELYTWYRIPAAEIEPYMDAVGKLLNAMTEADPEGTTRTFHFIDHGSLIADLKKLHERMIKKKEKAVDQETATARGII